MYATATEDMDALTFGSPVMLKNLFDTVGKIQSAYMHAQYVKIVNLSSAGVEVEE